MSEQVVLLGAEVGAATEAGANRIRKQILPKNKVYRWPNQPGKMLHITEDVLRQVVANFTAGVVDVVPFFKVNDKNAHVEDPEFSRGRIVDLHLTDDGLDAVIECIDEDTRKMVLATGLGASAGLNLAYQTHDTGTNVGAVLRHVAWTPEPWIPGMRPFEQVSLSNETFEAVFLSTDEGKQNGHEHHDGGENDMTPEEIRALIAEQVKEQTATLSAALETANKTNEALTAQVGTLTESLNRQAGSQAEGTIDADLSAMVEAGLPPAIAELSKPILMAGANEVNLSGGETSTVAAQFRKVLALIPKVDFSEKGEAGVPEGHVVLSAEQVKELGFKVEKEESDEDATLSAEQKADADAIASVTKFIPKDKRKEA